MKPEATSKYTELRLASDAFNEDNDCTVKGVALVTDCGYETAHQTLAELGRKKGQGCNRFTWLPAVEKIGYHYTEVTGAFSGKTVNSIEAELPKGEKFLITVRGHLLAFDGEAIVDFTAGRRHRILNIFHVAGTKCGLMDECKKKRAPVTDSHPTLRDTIFWWHHPDKGLNRNPDGEWRIYIRENGKVRWLNSSSWEWDVEDKAYRAAKKRWIQYGGEINPATIETD